MRDTKVLRDALPIDFVRIAAGQRLQLLARRAPRCIFGRELPAELRREVGSLGGGYLGQRAFGGAPTQGILQQFAFLRQHSIGKYGQNADADSAFLAEVAMSSSPARW